MAPLPVGAAPASAPASSARRPDNLLYIAAAPQRIGEVATLVEYRLDIGRLATLQSDYLQGYHTDATASNALKAQLDHTWLKMRCEQFGLLKDHTKCPGCGKWPEDHSVPAPRHKWNKEAKDLISEIGELFNAPAEDVTSAALAMIVQMFVSAECSYIVAERGNSCPLPKGRNHG